MPSVQTEMKTCSCCKQPKAFSEFSSKEYRCKACMAEKARRWNRKNRDRFNEIKNASYHRNKDTEGGQARISAYKKYRIKLKAEVFAAYGGYVCACCGERTPQFLTIDHIHNDGAEHRREIWRTSRSGSGSSLHLWLKNNGFPPGYQVLCYNCNCGKQRNGGICPHQSYEGVTIREQSRTAEVSTSAAGSAPHPYPAFAGCLDDEMIYSMSRGIAG